MPHWNPDWLHLCCMLIASEFVGYQHLIPCVTVMESQYLILRPVSTVV